MRWVKFDVQLPTHPKVMGLSDRAFRLFVETVCYCGAHLTDGEIPVPLIRSAPKKAVQELVDAGLFDISEEAGWRVHDFLAYNRSRADVEGEKDASRERMRDVRANTERSSSEVRGMFTSQIQKQNQKQKKQLLTHFDEFWSAYPRKVGKRTAESAFARACERGDTAEIIAGARRLADDPNLPDQQFIPHPTTWLNRDGWLDDPLPPRGGDRARGVGNILALADRMEAR